MNVCKNLMNRVSGQPYHCQAGSGLTQSCSVLFWLALTCGLLMKKCQCRTKLSKTHSETCATLVRIWTIGQPDMCQVTLILLHPFSLWIPPKVAESWQRSLMALMFNAKPSHSLQLSHFLHCICWSSLQQFSLCQTEVHGEKWYTREVGKKFHIHTDSVDGDFSAVAVDS